LSVGINFEDYWNTEPTERENIILRVAVSGITTLVNPTVERVLVEFERIFAAGYGQR
jgi:hypothetical protein